MTIFNFLPSSLQVSHQWHSLEISFVKGVVHIIDNDQLILNSTAYPGIMSTVVFMCVTIGPRSIGCDTHVIKSTVNDFI